MNNEERSGLDRGLGLGEDRGTENGTWVDVTDDFKTLSADLQVGELKLSDGFTLYDSLSALELMAPKMDPGMRPGGYMSVEKKLKQLFSQGDQCDFELFPKDLSEFVLLCHHWLKLEVAWLEGQNLLSTVFSCIFTKKEIISTLKQKAKKTICEFAKERLSDTQQDGQEEMASDRESFLQAVFGTEKVEDTAQTVDEEFESFLFGLIYGVVASVVKTSEIILSVVVSADVFAEEDFAPYVGSLEFDLFPEYVEDNSDTGQSVLVKLLDYLLEQLSSRPALCSDALTLKKLEGFLKFRRDFLRQNLVFDKIELQGFHEAQVLSVACMQHLQEFAVPLTTEPKKLEDKEASKETDKQKEAQFVARFFDPFLWSTILGPAPPRPVSVADFPVAVEKYRKVLADTVLMTRFVHCDSLLSMYDFLQFLSLNKPNILVRSRVVPALYTAQKLLALGKHQYLDLIKQDMVDFGVRDEVFEDASTTEMISNLLIRSLYDIFRLSCSNRSRVRRNVLNTLKSYKDVYVSCQFVDRKVFLNQFNKAAKTNGHAKDKEPQVEFFDSFSAWSASWSGRLIQEFILLGFEIELYAPDELLYLLWLTEFILKSNADAKKRMEMFKTREVDIQLSTLATALKELNLKQESDNSKATKKKKKEVVKDITTLQNKKEYILKRHHNSEAKLQNKAVNDETNQRNEIIRLISSSLLCVVLALKIHPRVLVQDFEHSTAEVVESKYKLRFDTLRQLNPDIPAYELLEEALKQNEFKSEDLFKSAEAKLSQAKQICQQRVLSFKAEDNTSTQCLQIGDVKRQFYAKFMRLTLSNLLMVKQLSGKFAELTDDAKLPIKLTMDCSLQLPLPILKVEYVPTSTAN